jgi:aldehyde dehydrogenase (NAD+)
MTDQSIEHLFITLQEKRERIGLRTVRQRKAVLRRLENSLIAHRQAIRDAMSAEFSKAQLDTDYSELYQVLSEIRHARRHLKSWAADQPVATPLVLFGTRSWVRHESKGVVLIISPWNFPLNLAFVPMALAIAAGNCVMMKPSEFSTSIFKVMKSIIDDVFTEGEVVIVEGKADIAERLTRLPFDHIMFTGSTRVGKLVMAAAAQNLVPVTLELGGKSPVIIDHTANIDEAVKKIVWGRFFNTGQTCVAPDLVLVDKKVKAEFVEKIKRALVQGYGEFPQQNPDYSRLVSVEKTAEKAAMLAEVRRLGCEEIIGGETEVNTKYCSPTVVIEPHPESRIAKEEAFGPILSVIGVDDVDSAIVEINRRQRPLTLYIFSKNQKTIHRILSRTRSGSVGINEVVIQFSHPGLPFGGTGHSGFGRSHGEAGFKELSNVRSILKRSLPYSTSFLAFAPHTRFRQWVADMVIKYF